MYEPAIVAFKYSVVDVFQITIIYCQCFLWSAWLPVKNRGEARYMKMEPSRKTNDNVCVRHETLISVAVLHQSTTLLILHEQTFSIFYKRSMMSLHFEVMLQWKGVTFKNSVDQVLPPMICRQRTDSHFFLFNKC